MNNRLPEFSFLLATARMKPSDVTATILEQATEGFNWELLVQTAIAHGVTGLLCRSL